MEIAVFAILATFTLAGLGYPLWSKPGEAMPDVKNQTVDRPSALPCSQCGRELQVDERFCPRCGTPAGARCGVCGRALDGDERFCPGCGAKTGHA